MTKRFLAVAAAALVGAMHAATVVHAQPANPITTSVRSVHDIVRGYITRSAEQFPEDQYGFQPTKEVRTFGQLLGHIANANYAICGTATGQKGPGVDIEKTATTATWSPTCG